MARRRPRGGGARPHRRGGADEAGHERVHAPSPLPAGEHARERDAIGVPRRARAVPGHPAVHAGGVRGGVLQAGGAGDVLYEGAGDQAALRCGGFLRGGPSMVRMSLLMTTRSSETFLVPLTRSRETDGDPVGQIIHSEYNESLTSLMQREYKLCKKKTAQ